MEKGKYGETYNDVIRFVRAESRPVRARELADGLGLDVEVAAAWLGRAMRRGHVMRVRRGEYTVTD